MLMSVVQVHLPPPSQNQPLPVGFFLPLSPYPPFPLRWRGFPPWRDGRRWPRRPRSGAGGGALGGGALRFHVPPIACFWRGRLSHSPRQWRGFSALVRCRTCPTQTTRAGLAAKVAACLQHPRRCFPHPKPCTPPDRRCCTGAGKILATISYHKTHLDMIPWPEGVATVPAASIPRQTLPKASQQDIMNGSVCESRCEPSRQARPASDHNAPPVTGQRKPAQTAWPELRVWAAKVLGRLEATTTITALLLIPVLSLPCAALGATAPIGSGLAWLQSQILSDGQLSRASALVAPTQARCETAKTLLRLSGSSPPPPW